MHVDGFWRAIAIFLFLLLLGSWFLMTVTHAQLVLENARLACGEKPPGLTPPPYCKSQP